MNGRLYLVTYYWPPAGGPGVQRWLGFTKYLSKLGWDITVVKPRAAAYPILDPSLNAEVSPGLEVVEVPIWEPGQLGALLFPRTQSRMGAGILPENNPSALERLLLSIRANLFVPDARMGWVGPLVRSLKPRLSGEDQAILITTGPPHSIHLAGLRLKQALPNLTWLADFRDPWTGISYHGRLPLSERTKRLHKEWERRVLNSADRLLVTSEATGRAFSDLTDTPIGVFTNGFDLDPPTASPDPVFRFTHMGSLLTERNPVTFWKAISRWMNNHSSNAHDFQFQLWGTVSDEVVQSATSEGLAPCLTTMGYTEHDRVAGILARAQVLVLIEADNPLKREIIPGKLFEYLQSRRPILAIGPEQWEAGKLVEELNAGYFVPHGQEDRLVEVLSELYQQFTMGPAGIPAVSSRIEPFSRQAISQRLSDYLYGSRIQAV